MGSQIGRGTGIIFLSERNSIRYGRMSHGFGDAEDPVLIRIIPIVSSECFMIVTIAEVLVVLRGGKEEAP